MRTERQQAFRDLIAELDVEALAVLYLAGVALKRGDRAFADRVIAFGQIPPSRGLAVPKLDTELLAALRARCDDKEAAHWGRTIVSVAMRGDASRGSALVKLIRGRVAQ